ncbi:hypothetical protein [Cohnella caldifontis]|uniref:hypothetical protein n=1 Tax=Cohnella caldifontis TaxID=3027471 RepID=UPI0023EC4179|nr:hypothetical protein [Cohnella sp. YIM B05605]
MPYALRNTATGELLAYPQINGYRLPYYGVRLWNETPDDAGVREALSDAGSADLPDDWHPVELTEHQAKMANVKLRNDPRRRIFLQDQVLTAVSAER